MSHKAMPEKQGLYDPDNERDSCGVGFVADIKNRKSHKIVQDGLTILKRLHHRGAVGADPKAGDGAGILVQIPDEFFREVVDFELPPAGEYGVGHVFLPRDDEAHARKMQDIIEECIAKSGQTVLGWRDVPTDNSDLGFSVLPSEPAVRQVFVGCEQCPDQEEFERRLFITRKAMDNQIRREGYTVTD